jgi:hypothetical protein
MDRSFEPRSAGQPPDRLQRGISQVGRRPSTTVPGRERRFSSDTVDPTILTRCPSHVSAINRNRPDVAIGD